MTTPTPQDHELDNITTLVLDFAAEVALDRLEVE